MFTVVQIILAISIFSIMCAPAFFILYWIIRKAVAAGMRDYKNQADAGRSSSGDTEGW